VNPGRARRCDPALFREPLQPRASLLTSVSGKAVGGAGKSEDLSESIGGCSRGQGAPSFNLWKNQGIPGSIKNWSGDFFLNWTGETLA
jgi:hypothetical protein